MRALKTALLIGIAAALPALVVRGVDQPRAEPRAAYEDSGPIINRAALNSFFSQLAAIESHSRQRPIRIMQYGDSHTKADLFTGAVRRDFLRDFSGDTPRLIERTAYRAGTNSQQAVYQPLGINGARAKKLRVMVEAPGFLQSLAENRPDLIVLAYGTNEVTDEDWTVSSYSRMLVGIISSLHAAAPNASILIIGPPDRSVAGAGGWRSVTRMPLLMEAQRRAAFEGGAAFWSAFDAMGGAGSMNEWVARGLGRFDHVHFSAGGYSRLAGLFYRDLMNAYRKTEPAVSTPLNSIDLRVMRGVPISPKHN